METIEKINIHIVVLLLKNLEFDKKNLFIANNKKLLVLFIIIKLYSYIKLSVSDTDRETDRPSLLNRKKVYPHNIYTRIQ